MYTNSIHVIENEQDTILMDNQNKKVIFQSIELTNHAIQIEEKSSEIEAYVVKDGNLKEFKLMLGELTDDERDIILKGCLINYNRR